MAFFNKRMILFFTNLFLLVGIGTTIANYSTSVIQGEAGGSTNIVIAQIYSGSGGTGASYNRDFVVLFNLSSNSQSLSNWSLQYASSTGTTWSKITLSGSISAYRYFLIVTNSTDGVNGSDVDTGGDIVGLGTSSGGPGTYDMALANGKLALLNNNNSPGSVAKPTTGLVDFVGFGSANEREGSSSSDNASAGTVSLSIIRKNFLIDTDNNKNDFETGNPNPLNSSSKSTTAEIFSNYFLLQTENKNGLCTDVGLGWSTTLESDYNNLSSGEKALFVANSANSTIANAVNRYQYLRTIEPSLNNFANL